MFKATVGRRSNNTPLFTVTVTTLPAVVVVVVVPVVVVYLRATQLKCVIYLSMGLCTGRVLIKVGMGMGMGNASGYGGGGDGCVGVVCVQ